MENHHATNYRKNEKGRKIHFKLNFFGYGVIPPYVTLRGDATVSSNKTRGGEEVDQSVTRYFLPFFWTIISRFRREKVFTICVWIRCNTIHYNTIMKNCYWCFNIVQYFKKIVLNVLHYNINIFQLCFQLLRSIFFPIFFNSLQ